MEPKNFVSMYLKNTGTAKIHRLTHASSGEKVNEGYNNIVFQFEILN